MNEDRLTGLLGSLRHERMDRIADDKTRSRLENAWTTRMERRSFGFRARRLVPVLATLALFAGLGGATMNAAGDSPLYGLRTAVEDVAVILHPNPEDRAEYLLSLLEQRQGEAARLESSGNALAASRVREIEQRTLKQVLATVPQAPDTTVETSPSPTPTEAPLVVPSPSPTPSPTPTASPTPAVTVTPRTPTPIPATPRPTPTTATPTRTPTAPPSTQRPSPTPAPTAMLVQLTGNVRNPDLTMADGACASITPPTSTTNFDCPNPLTIQGAYKLAVSAKLNQQVTVYAWKKDPATGLMLKGYAFMTVKGTTVQMPDIKLAKVQ